MLLAHSAIEASVEWQSTITRVMMALLLLVKSKAKLFLVLGRYMKKCSLEFLKEHTVTESALAPLTFNDAMPYQLFIETVEQVPIAISITDKKANILYVNQEFTVVTGYQAEAILGLNEAILSDQRTPRTVYDDLWQTIRNKKIWRGTLCNRHQSGCRYIADLTVAPILDECGKITHYLGMHRDITKTHEAEQRIINQKLLNESVINAAPMAMVVIDEQDRVILDNHNYKALITDLDRGEPATLFLHLLREEMREEWRNLQSNQQGFSNREFKIESKAGRRAKWFSCAGNWFKENAVEADAFFDKTAKPYLVLTITDITRQRQHMEALHIQTLKTIMSEDERVRGIRETLLGAIHQIQMPMNQIRAAEQILKHKNDAQNAGLLQILQQIQQSGEEAIMTMQNCIPEILQTTLVSVNLNKILHEVLLLNDQRIWSLGIDLQWQPLTELPNILGSENRLRVLFNQLLDNAIDAVSDLPSGEPSLIRISTDADSELLYVSIEDSGPGIPEDKRSRVFEPFYTTRPNGGQKAGMGLVIAKEIVNQHHGFIDIDPSYDQGCRIKISFPLLRNTDKPVFLSHEGSRYAQKSERDSYGDN